MKNKKERKHWVQGMRDTFSDTVYELARGDRDIILVTSDTGAICHDKFREELPDQYINVGIAEQNMIGLAAGLAMSGKKVFVYAIVPFATMRCYEQIRVNLCCMNLPVTVTGIGAGFDYSTLGPTHHGSEDIALMRLLPCMTVYSPPDSIAADSITRIAAAEPGPKYIRLDRTGVPLIYEGRNEDFTRGMAVLRTGADICIAATGRMVLNALSAADILGSRGIETTVIDIYRLKPLNEDMLFNTVKDFDFIVTMEEHFLNGGLGTLVNEMLVRKGKRCKVKNFGIPDMFCRQYDAEREYLQGLMGLDAESVSQNLIKIMDS